MILLIWHCPMKNQNRALNPPTPTPHTEEDISKIKFILSLKPKQLLFSDFMHLHGPTKLVMLTYQIIKYLFLEH